MSALIEEILPDLYRVEIPLPGSPLKSLNSYVIKAGGRSLIIDTGWNHEKCMEALSSGLKEIGVNLKKADFFITHLHADHSGLVSNLATDTSTIYFGQADAAVINSFRPGHWEKVIDFARMNGFPEDELERAIKSHPGYKYSARGRLGFYILKEGDTISIGDYLFKCIETPGHTKGHTCLYEPNKKIFISGDHILIDITPNISLWSDEGNPLDEYLASLEKVYSLDIKLVLPGHRRIFRNHKKRIQELKCHHQARLNEVVSILEKGKQNAFQVASQMTWGVTYKSWDLFPLSQKWFAFGEAMAHLKFLEERGGIRKETQGRDSSSKSGEYFREAY